MCNDCRGKKFELHTTMRHFTFNKHTMRVTKEMRMTKAKMTTIMNMNEVIEKVDFLLWQN